MIDSIPTSSDDVIDSRDVIAALEGDDISPEDRAALTRLAEQGEGLEDWQYGVALVRESYFTEYAQELAEEPGEPAPKRDVWPWYCIDWEYAARELLNDYTSVDFGGVTYYAR